MTSEVKICGMKHNVSEVAQLLPDYLGFIFYEKSPRNFSGAIPALPANIGKVGVFVDASLQFISEKIQKYQLDVVQLHGEESAQFCRELRAVNLSPKHGPVKIWKVFGIRDSFDFSRLAAFEGVVDRFLFDTKGKAKGGNGYTFNWEVLNEYSSKTPFVLSGGIGLEEVPQLKAILKTTLPVVAIDINSRFEIEPGLKDIEKLKRFTNELSR